MAACSRCPHPLRELKHRACVRLPSRAPHRAVKKFAEAFKAKHQKLHYLINNAAIMATPFERTKDGNEAQMQANHFSHFLLTGLLIDRLRESAPARIVNHASSAHTFVKKIRFVVSSENRCSFGLAQTQWPRPCCLVWGGGAVLPSGCVFAICALGADLRS